MFQTYASIERFKEKSKKLALPEDMKAERNTKIY